MIGITLKDGSVREFEPGIKAADIVKSISMGLYKNACAVKINGIFCDLHEVLREDCTFEVFTFADDRFCKDTFNHTASHILAQAVKRLYKDVKLSIGPAIDDGFYYDFDTPTPFTPEDLVKIEAEMKKIIKEDIPLEKFELPADEAIKYLTEAGEPYKVILCKKHADAGEAIKFVRQGDFTDLCAGPHMMSTGLVKAVKLTNATGAYFGGDAKGKQLTRVYGTAFPKASELEAHLARLEEARKRDHNKLGRELEYFTTVDVIGQGLPIMLPKGAKVLQILQRWIEDEEQKRGYQLTKTPYMAKSDLYKISGHWGHYRDGMFVLGNPDDEEQGKEVFALRPMTCPFQYQVFLNRKRSYRDLPMRLNETSTLFRNEDSGEMHGLIRVRQFTLSEGHIILRPEQLEEEFKNCLELANYCLETLGLSEDVSYRFSQWDPNNKEKYVGSTEQWENAQSIMGNILDNLGLKYSIGIDEAAFYGPKLDIQIKNVFGKEDTLITIQIDPILAEKFDMEYVDTDGKMRRPYIIHRSSLGCYERTLALIIEKYAGALPLWLSPEQIRILPVTDRAKEYAESISAKLLGDGVRATVDNRNEKVGYKIRQAQMEKVPYFFIVGDNEVNDNTVSLRSQKSGDLGVMPLEEVYAKIFEEINTKAR
ncbi:MAG: threonine--tRNA ligase [Ruminococcus sp.]|jgi:threonyl-tRNA synthetase|nr:threonine--tRNA ligase [Ruminococcus sp.]